VHALRHFFSPKQIMSTTAEEFVYRSLFYPKEKHESFNKREGFLSGYSCNRRWFTIERAPKSGDDGSSDELLLCYYKLSSAELEQRCGWLFLNDITSLTQDLPNRWITIEHPARVIRIQSPTPAQVIDAALHILFLNASFPRP
jgi:hypothetical protein